MYVEKMLRCCFVITGSGKRPEDWITLVSCVRYCDLNRLADTIEAQYHKGDSTGEPALSLSLSHTHTHSLSLSLYLSLHTLYTGLVDY